MERAGCGGAHLIVGAGFMRKWLSVIWVVVCGAAAVRAAEPSAGGLGVFEKKVRAVFAGRCYECHSATAKKLKGKLRLDTREDLEAGGESGKVIVAGAPDQSLLIKAVKWASEDLQMPPKKKLSDGEIADLVEWVKRGAAYTATPGAKSAASGIEAAKQFWSFQKPKPQAVPQVKNSAWAKSEVDRFIAAKLEEKGLNPGRLADKRTLLRRATFDLTGLPPTTEEMDSFL